MKAQDSADYIHSLIEEGEHVNQDFKFEISDARKIAKSFSAFANTEGGRLLIGVKDNGKISGVSSDEEAYMAEAAANVYCSPHPEFSITPHKVDGKTVLEVTIPESPTKPICAIDEENRKWAYVRIADENIQATAIHLEMWQQGGMQYGVTIEFTDTEKDLLNDIENDCFSVNKFAKKHNIDRRDVQKLIAKLVRFGVLDYTFVDRKFQLSL